MKIVMVSDGFISGLGYQENLLVKYYLKLGHIVTIITSTYDSLDNFYNGKYDKSKPETTIIENGVKIIRLKFSLFILDKIKKFKSIYNFLEEERPDVIFFHDISFNLHEAVKYKVINPKCYLIMDYHADYSNSAKNWISLFVLHKTIRRTYLNFFIKSVDKIFPINTGSKIFLNEVYCIPNEIMTILPLGVDDQYTDSSFKIEHRHLIRKKHAIPENSKVIFSGGKINKLKKLEDLIEAFNIINIPDLFLIVVGKIEKLDVKYEEFIRLKIQSSKNIIHTGWVSSDDIYKYMAASDIAVFPASQSVLWQQAMGMGLVTVIGKYVTLNDGRTINQHVEYLNQNNNILILESQGNKTNEILKKLELLLSNNDYFNLVKSNNEEFSGSYLSYEAIAMKTIEN